MKKLAALNCLIACLALTVALGLLAAPAQAYVYDDFTSAEFDTNLWHDSYSGINLFSQHDGSLYFSDPYPGHHLDGYYSASRWDTLFFVSMEYTGFQATNNRTEDWTGSGPVLWIGDSTNSVRVFEYINDSSIKQGFRAAVSG